MKKLVFVFFIFLIFPMISDAKIIGVSPSRLDFDDEQEKTLIIFNPNNETIRFTVENNDPENIILSEDTGDIAPNERRKIIVSIKEGANIDSTINIFISDDKKEQGILTGAEVNVHAENKKEQFFKKPFFWILIIGMLITLSIIIFR